MTVPIQNVYYLLCYAWGHAEERGLVDVSALEEFTEMQDLFGKILAEGTFRLLRRGIDRGYREFTEEIPGVRGKLEVGKTLKRASLTRSRTVCTFVDLSRDVLHNQILRSSLDALLGQLSLSDEVREDVSLAYRRLEGIETIRLSRQAFRRVQLDRNMRMYRFLLSVCRLVHESLLADRETGSQRFVDFREDDRRMWKLYEDFVLEFYRREQDRFRVLGQKKIEWHDAQAPEPSHLERVPGMHADVVLESLERRIILDTKFYSEPFAGRFGTRKLHSGNLYQLLTYLENREGAASEGPRHEGLLLYPTVDETVRVDVVLNGFRVQARSVDLDQPWGRVHEEMLEVLAGPHGTRSAADGRRAGLRRLQTRAR